MAVRRPAVDLVFRWRSPRTARARLPLSARVAGGRRARCGSHLRPRRRAGAASCLRWRAKRWRHPCCATPAPLRGPFHVEL